MLSVGVGTGVATGQGPPIFLADNLSLQFRVRSNPASLRVSSQTHKFINALSPNFKMGPFNPKHLPTPLLSTTRTLKEPHSCDSHSIIKDRHRCGNMHMTVGTIYTIAETL